MGNDEIDKRDIEFGPARWECKTVRMPIKHTSANGVSEQGGLSFLLPGFR